MVQAPIALEHEAPRPPAPPRFPAAPDLDPVEIAAAVEAGEPAAIPSALGVLRGVASAVLQPGPLLRESTSAAQNLSAVLTGTQEFAPAAKDKRFSDPTWRENAAYRRLAQSYIALSQSLDRLVDELEQSGAPWPDVERARFAVNALISTAAPTNLLPGNPAALKRAFETGGRSMLRGMKNFVSDVRTNGGMPSQTDRRAFAVGKDLALTPGAVVHRGPLAELLHYAPTTAEVGERPLLVIPPPIGRYYFLDLRPGRSFVEYAVSQGLQVFLLSWRNPQREQSQWGLDEYAQTIVKSIEAMQEITGSPDVNTLGFCAGGILQATVLNHLEAKGDPSVHAASFGVTLLDFDERAPLGAFSAPRVLDLAGKQSRSKGLISAASLGAVFSWMRPDDLIFNYVVNNWLLGNDPPVFDILAWNADGANLPAKLHGQFLDIFRTNALMRPGSLSVLGTPIDLSRVELPIFVTGAINDHLTPWMGCYRTTTALSGPGTYVLSNAGHIASLVNPPGNPKASYFADGPSGAAPSDWLAGATKSTGSWWEAWSTWIRPHSGELRPAPAYLGSSGHPPLEPAPGGYVVDRIPARL